MPSSTISGNTPPPGAGRPVDDLPTSIALCTYNGSRYLPYQLESIRSQTVLPGELVVCDDGSTDDTNALIDEFSRKVSFSVRRCNNPQKLGPAKNFEKAMGLCRGAVIILCDQDDVWEPSKIAALLRAFETNSDAVYAFSDAKLIDEEGSLTGQNLWAGLGLDSKLDTFRGLGQARLLLQRNVVTGAAMAIRASFINTIVPIPPGWMHDYWIALLGSIISYGVAVPATLFRYRRHTSQVCGVNNKTFIKEMKVSMASDIEKSQNKIVQFRTLIDRLQQQDPAGPSWAERLELVRQKEVHLLKRAEARSSRGVARIATVLREASTGRYQRFSESWLSIMRDL